MIKGIGTDILLIQRMREILQYSAASFIEKVFSREEQEQAKARSDSVVYYAMRFAGKEAVIKCFGDVAGETGLNEIEIRNARTGKPEVRLLGKTRKLAKSMGISTIQISLSYDGEYALAFAIASDDAGVQTDFD